MYSRHAGQNENGLQLVVGACLFYRTPGSGQTLTGADQSMLRSVSGREYWDVACQQNAHVDSRNTSMCAIYYI